MLRIDSECQAGQPTRQILTFVLEDCGSAKKLSIEKPILLKFVNLSTTLCPRLYSHNGHDHVMSKLWKQHHWPASFSYWNNFWWIFQLHSIPYRSKKVGLRFSSTQIFVTLGKFCHLGPMNNLGRWKFGLFLKFHKVVKFVFKCDISSFRLVNSYYIL